MDVAASTAKPNVVADFDRVIVPVSFYPPNNRSIRVAEYLAAQFGCGIELTSMLYDRDHAESRQQLLEKMAGELRGRTVRVTLRYGTDPAPFVLDLIGTPDSLVVLAGGTTVLGIPGSVTADVLRFASRPAVLVGPRVAADWHGPVKHLVVPLDGSRSAEEALPTATEWARASGALLDLVQVVTPRDAAAVSQLDHDVEESAYLEQVGEALEHTAPVRINWDVLHASALHRSSTICDRAAEQPGGMICMATHGSGHSHSMFASTTLRVIHHSTVPVLVTRS